MIESSERCKDEDGFLVADGVGGGRDIIEVVMDDGGRFIYAIERGVWLDKRSGRRR